MKTTANVLDLSPLSPAERREVRDFYQFLLTRDKKAANVPTDAQQEHDRWFHGQVVTAVKEADDPATEFIPHETVRSRWAEKRNTLKTGAAKGKHS